MSFGLKIENFGAVRKSLREADPAINKALTKELRLVSTAIVTEARSRAAWSLQIPKAISAVSTGKTVGIKVSSKIAIATLNERGPWRHKLFGNPDFWYGQTARPSVGPVVDANRLRVRARIEHATRAALKEAGL